MSNFIYNEAKRMAADGAFDWTPGAGRYRVMLVKDNTTADTEKDANTLSGFSSLNEVSGGSYARQTIANRNIAEDAGNFRAELNGDPVTFTSIPTQSPQQIQAALVVWDPNSDDNNATCVPIAFIDTGGFPIQGNGGNITVTWSAEGILQVT